MDVDITVVDNASGDGSAEMVADQFPWVRLIRNDRNRGFGAAHNQALRGANGLFLSPRRSGEVVADAPSLGQREILEVVHRGGGRIALRTIDGCYLTRSRDDIAQLRADAPSPGEPETFTLSGAHDTESWEGMQ